MVYIEIPWLLTPSVPKLQRCLLLEINNDSVWMNSYRHLYCTSITVWATIARRLTRGYIVSECNNSGFYERKLTIYFASWWWSCMPWRQFGRACMWTDEHENVQFILPGTGLQHLMQSASPRPTSFTSLATRVLLHLRMDSSPVSIFFLTPPLGPSNSG